MSWRVNRCWPDNKGDRGILDRGHSMSSRKQGLCRQWQSSAVPRGGGREGRGGEGKRGQGKKRRGGEDARKRPPCVM